jgi:uncharacterized membrane protein YesL
MFKNLTANPTRNEWIDKVSVFVMLNILWMVLAVLIVPIPFVTVGIFAVLMAWVQGKSIEPWGVFLAAARKYGLKACAILLGDLALLGLAYFNFQVFGQMEMSSPPALLSLSITIFVVVLTLLSNLYLWPLLVTVERPLLRLIRTALTLVALNPAWSFFAALLSVLPLLSLLILPGFFVLLGTYTSCALAASWGAWHVLEKYNLESL